MTYLLTAGPATLDRFTARPEATVAYYRATADLTRHRGAGILTDPLGELVETDALDHRHVPHTVAEPRDIHEGEGPADLRGSNRFVGILQGCVRHRTPYDAAAEYASQGVRINVMSPGA